MKKTLEDTRNMTNRISHGDFWGGVRWGFLGGLAGTLIMDILLMVAFLALRQPIVLCFSIVGDTVARFLEMFGAKIAGGVPTGMVTHYLIGPLFGILFGGAVTKLSALQGGSLRKIVVFGSKQLVAKIIRKWQKCYA